MSATTEHGVALTSGETAAETTESIGLSAEAETKNLFLEAAMLSVLVLVVLTVGGVMKRRKFHYFGETALCMMTGKVFFLENEFLFRKR